jgi:hypothetical protein
MTRIALTAAATLIALAAAMPAQALGPFAAANGISLNGLTYNGVQLNGRATQGINPNGSKLNGADMATTGGVSLLAIELPPQAQ